MTSGDAMFWAIAEPLLERPDVERSAMMGHECLRAGGAFVGMADGSGRLIVKLPAERVEELILAGEAEEFAPAGRVFREWAQLPAVDGSRWRDLLEEALAFAAGPTRPGEPPG